MITPSTVVLLATQLGGFHDHHLHIYDTNIYAPAIFNPTYMLMMPCAVGHHITRIGSELAKRFSQPLAIASTFFYQISRSRFVQWWAAYPPLFARIKLHATFLTH